MIHTGRLTTSVFRPWENNNDLERLHVTILLFSIKKMCHFSNHAVVGMDIGFCLPEHVHQLFIIFLIHCYVFWHLWSEAIVWHTNHGTPSPCTIYYSSITCCGLNKKTTKIGISPKTINIQSNVSKRKTQELCLELHAFKQNVGVHFCLLLPIHILQALTLLWLMVSIFSNKFSLNLICSNSHSQLVGNVFPRSHPHAHRMHTFYLETMLKYVLEETVQP